MGYPIGLDELIITQQTLRMPQQLIGMISYLLDGNKFQEKIILNRCEDGRHYILDGHHRICSMYYVANSKMLNSDDFELHNYTYKEFLDIVFLNSSNEWLGWTTPIDIKTHVRVKDLFNYKKHVFNIYYNQSPMHAIHYIKTNPDLYLEKRSIFRVRDLLRKHLNIINSPLSSENFGS